MGMFDRIYPERVFCPYCAHPMGGQEFQTKDGDCSLIAYNSWEAFGDTIPEKFSFHAYTSCNGCDRWIELSINNISPKALEYQSQRNAVIRAEYVEEVKRMAQEQNQEHPHHSVNWEGYGEYFVNNAHCDKCKNEGIESGVPHSDNLIVNARKRVRNEWNELHPRNCKYCGKDSLNNAILQINQLIKLGVKVELEYPICHNCFMVKLARGTGFEK